MSTRPIVGVGAIVVRDGRLLLVQRGNEPAKGLWSVPGGRLEFGESLADGAVRELREETGLHGTATAHCGFVERMAPGMHVVIHDYWVTVPDNQQPMAADDADDVTFASLTDLDRLPLVPRLKEFLADHDILGQLAP